MGKKKNRVEDVTGVNYDTSVKCTGLFAIDALLRKNGFRIVSRKPRQQPRWELCEKEYDEDDALDMIDPTDVADANMAEDFYYARK